MNQRVVVVAVLLGVIVVLFQVAFTTYASSPTAFASLNLGLGAGFDICINDPPQIVFDCETNLTQHELWSCQIQATDPDGDDLYYSFNYFSGYIEMNVSQTGLYTAFPVQSMVGQVYSTFSVTDTSSCSNNRSEYNVYLNIEDVNDPPYYAFPIDDLEWAEGQSLRGIFLVDHFVDPDDDTMTFTSSISEGDFNITILPGSEFIATTPTCGEGYVVFTAKDPDNATGDSTPIKITVPCVNEAPGTGLGGSGGGEGGTSSISEEPEDCVSDWRCDDWSRCYKNGTQKKRCADIRGCARDFEIYFWRDCVYVPQCENGKRDFGEDGIDCGGLCPKCETCEDNIWNNYEEGVDCGGPNCEPCVSCDDGIQNYGEEGVDCGGPCSACETCFDGILNNEEVDVDCGGPNCPTCKKPAISVETPESTDSGILLILVTVGVLIAAGVVMRVFKKEIALFFNKIVFYLTKNNRKQILLTKEQKNALLTEIFSVEKHGLLDPKYQDDLQDRIAVILRRYYEYVIGDVIDFQEASDRIDSLRANNRIKSVLKKHYRLLLLLEQTVKFNFHDLYFHFELLRERIFSTAKVSKQEVGRPVKEHVLAKDSSTDRMKHLLYNAVLALQFVEVHIAKEKYHEAMHLYNSMSPENRKEIFDILHLTYEEIEYVDSYTRDDPHHKDVL